MPLGDAQVALRHILHGLARGLRGIRGASGIHDVRRARLQRQAASDDAVSGDADPHHAGIRCPAVADRARVAHAYHVGIGAMQGRVAGHGQLAAHVQRDGTPPGRGQDILGRLVFRQGLTAEQFQAARDGVAAHRHLDGLAQRQGRARARRHQHRAHRGGVDHEIPAHAQIPTHFQARRACPRRRVGPIKGERRDESRPHDQVRTHRETAADSRGRRAARAPCRAPIGNLVILVVGERGRLAARQHHRTRHAHVLRGGGAASGDGLVLPGHGIGVVGVRHHIAAAQCHVAGNDQLGRRVMAGIDGQAFRAGAPPP